MRHDRPRPAADRLLAARISGIARRHARWGALTEDQAAAAVTELRQVADGRADLLAEVAGISLGASERKGEEYRAQARAVAELCRMAGADQKLVPGWVEIGRERAKQAGRPPSSQPGRAPRSLTPGSVRATAGPDPRRG
jgi:hypothetical protein